jgi:hypothetical protein
MIGKTAKGWIAVTSLLVPVTAIPLVSRETSATVEALLQDRPLSGPYFGQTPPGLEPEIFAPGVVSTSEGEGCIVFSADGRRVVFRRFGIAQLLLEGEDAPGGWRVFRVPPPFSRLDWYSGDFVLAPDSTSFYFTSARPIEDGMPPFQRSNIWVVQWDDGKWSTPTVLPSPIRTPDHQAYPTVTRDGTLYFFSWNPEEEDSDLFRSTRVNGDYTAPENLGPPVNSEYEEFDPFVAPDGSYIIFTSYERPGGYGNGDFYISFRQGDGSWSEPVNMGDPINSQANENRPFVTLDGRYFFFTSDRVVSDPSLEELRPGDRPGNGSRDIYWVDARVFDRFRPNG